MRAIIFPILLLIFVSPVTQGQDPSDEEIAKSSELLGLKTFRLKHARAENIALILNELFPPAMFSSDTLTNTLYAKLDDTGSQRILPFIERMEQAAKSHQEENLVARENNEKGKLLVTMTIPLKHVDAVEMEAALTKVGLAESGSVAAGPSGDVIVLRLPGDRIQYVAQVVERLDKPGSSNLLKIEQDLIPLSVDLEATIVEFGRNHPKARALKKRIETIRKLLSGELPTATDDPLKPLKSAEYATLETEITKVMDDWRQRQSKQPTADDIAPIKNDLTELVGKLFDLRQQTEESSLKKSQEQINRIRQRLDERKKDRDAIIQKRVQTLLNDQSEQS